MIKNSRWGKNATCNQIQWSTPGFRDSDEKLYTSCHIKNTTCHSDVMLRYTYFTGVCNSNKKTTLVLIDLPFCWKKDLNSASEMWIPWNRETNVNPFCQRNVYPLCQRYACPLDCWAKLCPAKQKCVSLCSSNQKCIPCAKHLTMWIPCAKQLCIPSCKQNLPLLQNKSMSLPQIKSSSLPGNKSAYLLVTHIPSAKQKWSLLPNNSMSNSINVIIGLCHSFNR